MPYSSASAWIRISSALVVLLGVFLGIIGATDALNSFNISENVRFYLAIFTASILLFVVLIWIILIVKAASTKTVNWLVRRSVLTMRTARQEDIFQIARLGEDVFGNRATSLAQTKRLIDIDKNMFSVAINSHGTIVGYRCIFRLSAKGVDAIKRNDFQIAHVPKEYVRTDNKKFRCDLYVGALYGDGMYVRGLVIGTLMEKLRELRPRSIYARAATEDGLRILLKYKFLPVKSGCEKIGDMFFRVDTKTEKE